MCEFLHTELPSNLNIWKRNEWLIIIIIQYSIYSSFFPHSTIIRLFSNRHRKLNIDVGMACTCNMSVNLHLLQSFQFLFHKYFVIKLFLKRTYILLKSRYFSNISFYRLISRHCSESHTIVRRVENYL